MPVMIPKEYTTNWLTDGSAAMQDAVTALEYAVAS
jgi:hypothetical protein